MRVNAYMGLVNRPRSGEGVLYIQRKDLVTLSCGWRMSPYQRIIQLYASFIGCSPTYTLNDGTPHIVDHVFPIATFVSWPPFVLRIHWVIYFGSGTPILEAASTSND